MTCAITASAAPQLSLSDDRFPAFIRHLVKRDHYRGTDVLDVIEHPQDHQKKFVAYLCGVNSDDYRPGEGWDGFLERNFRWHEHPETGIEIDTPQLVADLTGVPSDELPQEGEKAIFQVRAHEILLCPDAFSRWSLVATAFLEHRCCRPCVVWEIEPSI